MAAKSDAPAEAAKGGTTPPMAAAAPAAKGGIAAMMPVILAVVLAPALTWAVATFVIVPQLQKKLLAPASAEAAAEEHAPEPAKKEGGHGKEGEKGGKEGGGPNYEFSNVVVNLAGTMGTRYLKTTFLVTGTDANIKGIFEANKPQLMDVTLNVLSSLTLSDLEEPGAKNVIREKLVGAYNQALKKKVADQVYFSDFVVQ
jgi:flagellar FliL protein